MKKFGMRVVFFSMILSATSARAMEKKIVYTPQTMLSAIKKGDREVLIEHQKNSVPIKPYILLALWNAKEQYIHDAFFRNPIFLSSEVFNEFVKSIIETIKITEQDEFSEFIHKIISATGVIPTVGGFDKISFYKNKVVQWYLNEIQTGALEPKEIKKLQKQLNVELEGYEKDLKNGEDNAYGSFFNLGFNRLDALVNDDKEIKNKYFQNWGKELTFDIVKHFRPSGPLITYLLMAIATDNKKVIDTICCDSSFLMREVKVKTLYRYLMQTCYKKNSIEEPVINQNRQNNTTQNVNQALQGINNSLDGLALVFGSFSELLIYGVLNKEMPLLCTALKIAALYNRVEIAKFLIEHANVNDNTTFTAIKGFTSWISDIVKCLNETGKLSLQKDEKEKWALHHKQRVAFMAMSKEVKEYVYMQRRFKEIKEYIYTTKDKNKQIKCTLPLLDENKNNIIVSADIGLKILEYCPLLYNNSNKSTCLIS